MHPSEKIQRILNQSLKCSYAHTEVICSLYVHYVTKVVLEHTLGAVGSTYLILLEIYSDVTVPKLIEIGLTFD